MSRVRIPGIGSPSGDDQAGWLTVDALLAAGLDEIEVVKMACPGASLIALLENASRAMLMDAMQSDDEPGRIKRSGRREWPDYRHGLSSHGFGVLDALSLVHALGGLPPRLDLYGIEIGSAMPGDVPSAEVQAAARRVARIIALEGFAIYRAAMK